MPHAHSAFLAPAWRQRALLLLIFVLLPASAFGCTPLNPDVQPPYLSAQSADKRFELRVRNTLSSHPDTRPSGMYKTDDPDHPLWTLDEADRAWLYSSFYVSSDGMHVARVTSFQPSLSLFNRAKLLRTYSALELITTSIGLNEMGCGYGTQWFAGAEFDAAAGTLTVTTLTGDVQVIDVASGNIVRSSKTEARMRDTEKVVRFDGASTTILLDHTEYIAGLDVPAGTEVTRSAATREIISATVRRPMFYKGIELQAGTIITLSGYSTYPGQEMTGITQPSEWSLGPLRIKGTVAIRQDNGLLVLNCQQGASSECIYQGQRASTATFWPDMKLRDIEFLPGNPFKFRLGDDVLATRSIRYWHNGHLRALDVGVSLFRGDYTGGRLKFWPDGSILLNVYYYCRNGERAKVPDFPPRLLSGFLCGMPRRFDCICE